MRSNQCLKQKVNVIISSFFDSYSNFFLGKNPVEKNSEEELTEYQHLEKQIHPDIPSDCYTCLLNVKGDGFCGFRSLALQLFGNEDRFWDVKIAMRDTLIKNKTFYKEHMSNYFLYGETLDVVSYGLEKEVGSKIIRSEIFVRGVTAPREYYFSSPDCAQLAADTFLRPIAVFLSESVKEDPATFFPLITYKNEEYILKEKPQPLIIQHVNGNHWITLSMRRARKMTWPLPSPVRERVYDSLGVKNTYIKSSHWNRYLIFKESKKSKEVKGTIYRLVS